MKEITLIQLVSAQATPNLLAAMAIKPRRIIHCCTPTMMERGERLMRAYKAAGLSSDVRTERLSKMPQVAELKALVEHLAGSCSPHVVLNFTGGTKLMSLGAFAGALQKRIASLYVDTDDGVFIDGQSGPGFIELFANNDISLGQVKRQLSVHTLAIANGCERVTNGLNWRPCLELADLLLDDPALEENCQKSADKFLQQIPRDFTKAAAFWNEQLRKPVSLPEQVLELGAFSGLFEQQGNEFFFHPSHAATFQSLTKDDLSKPWKCHPAFDALKNPYAFFQGIWWEVAVISHLDALGMYHDLRWSVQVGSRDASGTDLEEDILGIDDVNLLYVSCKRGGHKAQLSRTIEDVNSSAQRIGGSFAHKILAVCLPPTGSHRSRLETRCAELGIRLLTRDDLRG